MLIMAKMIFLGLGGVKRVAVYGIEIGEIVARDELLSTILLEDDGFQCELPRSP